MAGQIQLEGPDGSGKTTLLFELRKHVDVPVITYSPAQKKAVVGGGNWLAWIFYQSRVTGPAIYDRFFPSQMVYPSVFGREGFKGSEAWAVEGWCMAQGGLVVICHPPVETVIENMRKGTHEVADNDTLAEKTGVILKGFRDWAWSASLDWTLYDYTVHDRDVVISDLVHHIETAKSIEGGTGIGSPHAKLVLVGDRRREDVPEAADLPFCDSRMGSGGILMQALGSVGIGLRDVYITNSYEPRRTIPLQAELEQVGVHNVVALGNNADSELTKLGIPHRKVPHPAFIRRFGYNTIGMYGKEIAGA